MEAVYLKAYRSGLLEERIAAGRKRLGSCDLCPRNCGVDRLNDERGVCRTGSRAEVASYGPHFGEEAVLVGENGSGTIFFCGCNLLCVFCQNYDISHPEGGGCSVVSDEQLGGLMAGLQQQGCHNINFVTPSHVIPQIMSALPYAIEKGLTVPLVFNCGGYEEVDSIRLLDGIVDIYMPDFKFWEPESARRYMQAADYPDKARSAIVEMYRQVGDLVVADASGHAERGLLVRHLLMPGFQEETCAILRFLADLSKDTFVNIMDQYRPCGEAAKFAEINAAIESGDHKQAMENAKKLGLTRLDEIDMVRLLRQLFGK